MAETWRGPEEETAEAVPTQVPVAAVALAAVYGPAVQGAAVVAAAQGMVKTVADSADQV